MEALPGADVATVRSATIQAVENSVTRYGGAVSSLAAEFFDEVMEAEGVDAPRAEAWDGPDADAISQAVRYQAGKLAAGDEGGYLHGVSELASYHTRKAASSTVARSVSRTGHGVRYARVPTRANPCPYCLMLASRGFVYLSEESAGAGSHRNCTCAMVPGIPGRTHVDGYDPAELYSRWRSGQQVTASIDRKLPLYGGLTKQQLDAIDGMLSGAGNVVAAAYKRYEGDFVLADGHESTAVAFFSPDPNGFGVHLDIDRVARGDRISAPMQNWFHEFGHHMDWLAGDGLGYATSLNDGKTGGETLGQTVKDEFDGIVAKRKAELVTGLADAIERRDLDWIREHKTAEDWLIEGWEADLDHYKRPRNRARVWQTIAENTEITDDLATRDVLGEWASYGDRRATADLSDMVEGATDGKYNIGNVGHIGVDPDYWSDETGLRPTQSEEAFAEFTSSEFANRESLDVLKRALPKSYEHYRKIVEGMAT